MASHFARIGLIPMFTEIAREHYEYLCELEPKVNNLKNQNPKSEEESALLLYERIPIEQKLNKSALITIIFSALAIEAYIYDYGARNISDRFIQKYVDKLDVISKWVIIPQLVNGKEFPREGKGFELLGKLVKARNSIVHNKSYDMDFDRLEQIAESDEVLLERAKEAVNTIAELANDIESIDQEEYATFWLGCSTTSYKM